MERLLTARRRYGARLAALVVLGLALALTTAGTGSSAASSSSISISPKAYVYNSGLRLEAGVTFQCSGGIGHVFMQVSQTAAQSSNGQGAGGTQFVETANCDGSPHKLSVTIAKTTGGLFDIGKATAHAQLMDPSGFVAGDDRTIAIVSV
jgi:hypothetical protein